MPKGNRRRSHGWAPRVVTPEERRLEGLLGDIMGLFRAMQRRAQEAEQAAAQLEMTRRSGEPVQPLGGVIPPLPMGANQCEGRDMIKGGKKNSRRA